LINDRGRLPESLRPCRLLINLSCSRDFQLNRNLAFLADASRTASVAKIQQPGGDTPGGVAAPVALAGAIMPGAARYIVVLSTHADVFGVGITVAGSILVPPSSATTG
jgi:hypothetical protein